MLTFSPTVRVYVAPGSTDMRKSFDALAGLAAEIVEADPLSGHVFAFCNRRRTLVKLLTWDGSGFWIHAKRLERGTFAWPEDRDGADHVLLTAEELSWIIGGLDLRQVNRRKWWRLEPTSSAS